MQQTALVILRSVQSANFSQFFSNQAKSEETEHFVTVKARK